jgi:hypothetical protein
MVSSTLAAHPFRLSSKPAVDIGVSLSALFFGRFELKRRMEILFVCGSGSGYRLLIPGFNTFVCAHLFCRVIFELVQLCADHYYVSKAISLHGSSFASASIIFGKVYVSLIRLTS